MELSLLNLLRLVLEDVILTTLNVATNHALVATNMIICISVLVQMSTLLFKEVEEVAPPQVQELELVLALVLALVMELQLVLEPELAQVLVL